MPLSAIPNLIISRHIVPSVYYNITYLTLFDDAVSLIFIYLPVCVHLSGLHLFIGGGWCQTSDPSIAYSI